MWLPDRRETTFGNYDVMWHLSESSETNSRNYWKTPGIYAFVMGGHRGQNDEETVWYGYVAETGTRFGRLPGDVKPPYKLGAVGAYFCGSADQVAVFGPAGTPPTMSWRDLVSSSGEFVGFNGSVNRFTIRSHRVDVNREDIPD